MIEVRTALAADRVLSLWLNKFFVIAMILNPYSMVMAPLLIEPVATIPIRGRS